jgi:hypothetical protein
MSPMVALSSLLGPLPAALSSSCALTARRGLDRKNMLMGRGFVNSSHAPYATLDEEDCQRSLYLRLFVPNTISSSIALA